MPLPLGTAIQLGLDAAKAAAPLVAAAHRSPLEKDIAKSVEADRARLAGGAGGLSDAERQAYMADANGNIAAQARAQQEQLALAAPTAGSSGMAEQRQQALNAAIYNASNQAMSGVRQADIATGNKQRAELQAREAQQAALNKQRREAIAAALQGNGVYNGQMYKTDNSMLTAGAKKAGLQSQSPYAQGLAQVAGGL
jgi:hypothetical protein